MEIDTSAKKLVAATFGRGVWDVDLLEFVKKDTNTASISFNTHDLKISVFPNPVLDKLTVALSNHGNKKFKARIVDISGRNIQSFWVNSNTFTINTEDLLPGSYFLELEFGNRRQVARFLKE